MSKTLTVPAQLFCKMSDFQILMQESNNAHQNFKSVWRDWRSGKLKEAKGLKPHTEPKSVTEARNLFFDKNGALFNSKIEPLEVKFRENPSASLKEVIEFLSIDIPAFRCGYAKEVFLKWLKQTKFSADENKKLQSLIINVCTKSSFRREFRFYCRLSVKIADAEFVEKLQKFSNTKNVFAKTKSKWILNIIQQNRLDLRN